MDLHIALLLFFLLDLFSHGISVPVFRNYYENTPNEGYQLSDDIKNSYERYPRNILVNPSLEQYRWFGRRLIPSHPRHASKRHYHLFHLTSQHPNAVSYHVIEKPHATRTTTSRHRVESNPRRSSLYDNNVASQYQSYPGQSYYQQPVPNYQYPGYSTGYGSSFPPTPFGVQTGGGVHDSTYDDILQEVSKPMQIGDKIIPPYHDEARQNDESSNSIEEAAKQFKLASADMNNMELASLVIYPIPKFNDKPKVHKTKSKQKHKAKKHHDKKVNEEKEDRKVEKEGKTVTNLVDNLIKNDKEEKTQKNMKEQEQMEENKEDERIKDKKVKKENEKNKENLKEANDKEEKDSEDDEMDDKNDKESKEQWDEEEISTKGGDGYISSKRSEIPHAFDEISNSNGEDEYISSRRSEIPQAFEEMSSDDGEETDKSEINDKEKFETPETKDHLEEGKDTDSYENEGNDQESERKEAEENDDSDDKENKSEIKEKDESH